MVTRTAFVDGPIFDALGDPTRRAILELLRETPRAAGDIAAHFPVSRPAIAKHMRMLKSAGLVQARAEGRRQIYELDAAPLAHIDRWLLPYRAFWATRLVAIKHLVEAQENANERG